MPYQSWKKTPPSIRIKALKRLGEKEPNDFKKFFFGTVFGLEEYTRHEPSPGLLMDLMNFRKPIIWVEKLVAEYHWRIRHEAMQLLASEGEDADWRGPFAV